MPYAKYDGTDKIYNDKEELLKETGISIPDPILPPKKLVKLTGTLTDFKGMFCQAPLCDGAYMSKEERKKRQAKMRSGAALATVAGNTTVALAALGHGDDIHRSNYFDGQYITAKLNNNLILRGWLGFYQFKEGDEVEVVAEKHADHYEVYAMLKPSEQIISIIPPCTGGRKQSLKGELLLYFIVYILFTLCMVYFFSSFTLDNLFPAFTGLGILFIPAIFITYKRDIATYITLAERIFTTLGWQNVKNIDLVSMSKQQVKKRIEEGKYSTEYNCNSNDYYERPPKSGAGWYFFYYNPEIVCKKTPKKPSKKMVKAKRKK
ncbi:hypothetical protein J3U42_04610 [Gilliamella sp. B2923]|uniref:putative type VI secretion system effector n=1 Tax=Gilliamella sp. B2923 TaxID=2818005 RepID=UPI00226AC788|nr:putative type VI secretion system effector [Gilliamella sp. B2923]MCX8617670.1 hypothetical protein [Gilliamella sp. B2923]